MTKYISLIDCSDKFGVFFIYDDRYRIVVGDTDNLEAKLTYASRYHRRPRQQRTRDNQRR